MSRTKCQKKIMPFETVPIFVFRKLYSSYNSKLLMKNSLFAGKILPVESES